MFPLAVPLLLARLPQPPPVVQPPTRDVVHAVASQAPPSEAVHSPVAVEAPEPPKAPSRNREPGLAPSIGIGNGYAGAFGLQLAHYTARRRLQFGPYVAVGVLPTVEEAAPIYAVGAGGLGFWGERHRAFVQLDVGPVAYATLALHGTVVAVDLAYGVAGLAGYEFMADGGFFVRVGIGGGVTWGGFGGVQSCLGMGGKI